jgi:hypothetical protein
VASEGGQLLGVENRWARVVAAGVTDLVELERVEELVELAVLLLLLELDVVLLQTVQRELGLVIDVDLKRLAGGAGAPGSASITQTGAATR